MLALILNSIETSTTGHTTHHTTTPSTWSPSITESIIPDTLAPNVTNTSTTQQQEVDGTTTAVYTGTGTSITLSNGSKQISTFFNDNKLSFIYHLNNYVIATGTQIFEKIKVMSCLYINYLSLL